MVHGVQWVPFNGFAGFSMVQPLALTRGSMNRLNPNDPTVLWRMSRGRSTAHATIFPGDSQTTITWFFDGVMDRAENYESMELALARGDEIRGVLERDGWRMA